MDLAAFEQALEEASKSENLIELMTLSTDAIEKFPKSPIGYYYHGEYASHEVVNDLERAEWAYGTASALAEGNLDYLKKYVHAQEKLLKYEEAAGTYAYILSKFPDDFESKLSLGVYELRQKGSPENALSYFAEILQKQPENTEVYAYAAEAYMEMEDYEQAAAAVEYSLAKEFSTQAALTKIEILKKQELLEEIPLVFEKLVEENPGIFAFQYDYAKALFQADEYEDAQVAFEKALELREEEGFDTLMQTPIAENLLNLERYEEAVELFKKCIEHDQFEDNYLYELRAKAKIGAADYEGALADYDYLLTTTDDEFFTIQYNVNKAQIHILMGKTELAKDFFAGLEGDPIFASQVAYGKALLAHQAGDMDAAYRYTLEAMSEGYEDAEIFFQETFEEYIDQKREEVLAEHAGDAAKNEASALSQFFGKLMSFYDAKTATIDPAELETEDDKEAFKEMLEPYCLILTKQLMYIIPANFGVEIEDGMRAYAYAYSIEKAKDTLFLLKLTAFDKINTEKIKLKIDGDGLMFTKAADEVYKLRVHEDIDDTPFSLQERFAEVFEVLNPTESHPLDAETKAIVATLLYED